VEGAKTNYCLDYRKIEEMKNLMVAFAAQFEGAENPNCE
jgi:hypothetical protein